MSESPNNNTASPSTGNSNTSIFLIFLLFSSLLGAGIYFAVKYTSPPETTESSSSKDNSVPAIPDPERYKKLCDQLAKNRKELSAAYLAANSNNEKAKLLTQARTLLETEMPKMMRCWIGTPWDFNGTSQTPGEGKIACGYFVSVILRDTGFKVHRIRLARQASGNIIRSFVNKSDYKIFKPGMNYNKFVTQFKQRPKGIYIIGLDHHVGYLLNLGDQAHFLHSGANGVIDETELQAKDIKGSSWRSVGNITQHDYIIKKWLLGETIKTKMPKRKSSQTPSKNNSSKKS